jgi:hypothetical protein
MDIVRNVEHNSHLLKHFTFYGFRFNLKSLARVAELVDAKDSKSFDRKVMRVRFSPRAQKPYQGFCGRELSRLFDLT